MKKFNALSMTLLLGTFPFVTYAQYVPQISNVKVMPESMEETETEPSDDEIAFADWKGPWEDLFYLPDNIKVDNSNPRNMQLCSPDGQNMDYQEYNGGTRVMGPFTVTANVEIGGVVPLALPGAAATFNYPPPVILGLPTFPKDPSNGTGGGVAEYFKDINNDGMQELVWRLVQQDSQTWDLPWVIQLGEGVTLYSIEIDLLSKTGPGPKGGFDILLRPNDKPEHNPVIDDKGTANPDDDIKAHASPGSGAGWPVQPKWPIGPLLSGVDYTATYSKPIVLPGETLRAEGEHDLYGKVKIDFPNGITADSTKFRKDGALFSMGFIFWADTDCLPATSAEVTMAGKNQVYVDITAGTVGGDIVYFTQLPSGQRLHTIYLDHPEDGGMLGPFEVQPNTCYQAVSSVSGVIGEYCHE